jgi:DNA-binding IclR family transcriptional regulator
MATKQTKKPAAEPQDHPHKNHDAYFVPGLHRGLLVMEALATEQGPLNASEIAKRVGLTRSAVFRLIYTLRHMGFLEPTADTNVFGLGPRVLNLGFAYLASKDIIDISRPDLEQLRDETNVSSHLAIRDGREVLYLNCIQTRSGFLSNMNVGVRLPAYVTPMGWLLLSNLTHRELADLFSETKFEQLSEHTPNNLEALMIRVAQAAAKGHVVSRGLVEFGGSSIAAPILDKSGAIVGAIDISGPDSAFDLAALESRYVDAVTQAAQRISRRLGYNPRAKATK